MAEYRKIAALTRDPSVLGNAFRAYSANVIRSNGVDGFLHEIEGMEVPEEGKRAIFIPCLDKLEEDRTPGDALARLKGSALWRVGKDEGFLALLIASEKSPVRAMSFVDWLDDTNPDKPNAAQVAASLAVRNDANEAAKWIETLPEGPVRDAALRPLLDYLKQHGEEESLKMWSELLSKSDGEKQSK